MINNRSIRPGDNVLLKGTHDVGTVIKIDDMVHVQWGDCHTGRISYERLEDIKLYSLLRKR